VITYRRLGTTYRSFARLDRLLFLSYALQPSRLIVRSGLDVPTFATRRLHACHHARAPSGGRWNCGREMSREFCLNADLHFTFRDLLHAVKLRHGTDGFTAPPKEGVLRNFFLRPKNSEGFGRVRTRELVYQRSARYL